MLVDSRAMALLCRCRIGLISFALFATMLMLCAVALPSANTAAAKPAKRVTVVGKLTMTVVEGDKKKRSTNRFYVTSRGRHYQVRLRRRAVVTGAGVKRRMKPAARLAVLRGSKVLVTGKRRGRTIFATRVRQLAKSKARSSYISLNDRTVAVVAYYFPEDGGPKYSAADIRSAIFTGANSVRQFWLEETANQMKLVGRSNAENGDVFGPYPIARTATNGGSCKQDKDGFPSESLLIREDAENLPPASAELWRYDHVIYLGTGGTCNFRSYGDIEGNSVGAFADTIDYAREVAVHELGHNVGLNHANSARCFAGIGFPVLVRVPVSAACIADEYGDPHSIMGSGGIVHNIGAHAAKLGFFEDATRWTVNNRTDISVETYSHFPALTNDNASFVRANNWALRRCRDSACTGMQANDNRRFLSLDFRQRTGTFDTNLMHGNVDQGLGLTLGPDPHQPNVFEEGTAQGTNNFARVDTTPSTPSFTDGALEPNQWVYDPVADTTIRAGAITTGPGGLPLISTTFSAGPPTPSQGTVSIVSTSSTASRLQFTATAARQNILKVNYDSAASAYTVMTVHADGALTAGAGCTAVDRLSVRCPRAAGGRTVSAINLDLGDEADIGYVDPSVTVPATISGGTGDDWLVGGRGSDSLSGGDGNDGLATGGAGTDSLSGGAGDDYLWGGGGTETLDGGDDNDTLLPGKGGASTLQGGAGTDTLSYQFRSQPLTVSLDGVANDGESGENDNVGDGVANSIENILSGFGNDTLSGNGANNKIDGGSGTDTIEGHGGADTLLGGGDTVADNLYGENASGTLRGTAGGDTFPQGAGSDGGGVIEGDDGSDKVDYGERREPLLVTIANGALDDGQTGEGDNIRASVESVNLGYADDTASVSSGAGSTRVFKLYGNDGSDSLRGGKSADLIAGGAGNDPVLAGHGGNDQMYGGAGVDVMFGDQASGDTLLGTAGNDELVGDEGADTMYGGGGTDVASYWNSLNAVRVTIDNTANDGESAGAEGDNVRTDVENLRGGYGNDSLTGSTVANTIEGRAGADTISGGDGNDTLKGEDDNDTISGGNGNDTVVGDVGNDTLGGDAGADTLDGGSGNDTVNGGDADDTMSGGVGTNTLNGGNGNDTMKPANSYPDVLEGGAGVDTADYSATGSALTITVGNGANDGNTGGAEGDDVRASTENVTGGTGADRIVGSSVANRLDGAAGNDTLIGNGAADTLIGGGNSDTVWGDSELNLDLAVVPGADVIQTKDSTADNVDCGGQPTGISDSASVDQTLDILPFLIGPGICETVTY